MTCPIYAAKIVIGKLVTEFPYRYPRVMPRLPYSWISETNCSDPINCLILFADKRTVYHRDTSHDAFNCAVLYWVWLLRLGVFFLLHSLDIRGLTHVAIYRTDNFRGRLCAQRPLLAEPPRDRQPRAGTIAAGRMSAPIQGNRDDARRRQRVPVLLG